MLLNEHKSKTLFDEAGIPVPCGKVVFPDEQDDFGSPFPLPWFAKVQVLTGGRGKVGGIRRIESAEEFPAAAQELFDLRIKGHSVPFVRVEPAVNIQREFYLSMTVSRPSRTILFTLGRSGGMDIESMGERNLLVQKISVTAGLQPHHVRAAFFHARLEKGHFKAFHDLVEKLFRTTLDNGLLLAEINPLVLCADNTFLALDGKIEIDDNVVDLNPELERFHQPEHATPEENTARNAGLSFVSLPGWVGLMVNGAGLAMATMDLLNFSGLPASNFLDLGGAADHKRMAAALDLLFGDTRVKAAFINMFGGILSCADVARALLNALGNGAPPKPIVVRMAGKDAEAGIALLRDNHVQGLHLAGDMSEAISILATLKPADAPIIEFPIPDSPCPASRPAPTGYTCDATFDIDRNTPILVQGLTGREGKLHSALMREYGANIVAGVTPFKGGQSVQGIPVYNSVAEACRRHEIGASIIFVPPKLAADAVLEAASNNIPWAVCITEGIPQHDMLRVFEQIRKSRTHVVGPNTPGILVPNQTKIGILPTMPFSPGPVAILSRSGTLSYEVADRLTRSGIGQSLCVGIGGDPFIGVNFADMFDMLRNHEKTRAVVVLGEIGGRAEENLADYAIKTGFDKPVISFIAGRTAPPGRRLGHAGAILESGGGIDAKLSAMREAGFFVCPSLEAVAEFTAQTLK